jgi:16S rRNA (adenine1518-N6/adenine1519-N6)-dimethyltransferase
VLNLADPGILKSFLGRHGLSATKELGQHFLVSKSAVDAIVRAASIAKGIVEIGPGPGVLTSPLSEIAEEIIALELDPRMVGLLGESAPTADVRILDALKIDFGAIVESLPRPRGIVSNMPYYITGPLLQLVAKQRDHIDVAVLMMQKEVAVRIYAPPYDGERGSLSVYLQSLFEIQVSVRVPAGAFLPPPKVDSMVLVLHPRHPDPEMTEDYFRLIRLGFTQPRKTLANNLAGALQRERYEVVETLEACGLWEKSRAQELSENEWKALCQALADRNIPLKV